jgi:hypothetical protein
MNSYLEKDKLFIELSEQEYLNILAEWVTHGLNHLPYPPKQEFFNWYNALMAQSKRIVDIPYEKLELYNEECLALNETKDVKGIYQWLVNAGKYWFEKTFSKLAPVFINPDNRDDDIENGVIEDNHILLYDSNENWIYQIPFNIVTEILLNDAKID